MTTQPVNVMRTMFISKTCNNRLQDYDKKKSIKYCFSLLKNAIGTTFAVGIKQRMICA